MNSRLFLRRSMDMIEVLQILHRDLQNNRKNLALLLIWN